MNTVVITSGYFDPIHAGHLEYLKKAKEIGDYHVCIVNNDEQAKLKKGKAFMPEQDRVEILKSLSCVDRVILSKDKDESVQKTLTELVKEDYKWDVVIFAKGGDRNIGNTPEVDLCHKLGVYILEGLGDKIRSSSDFIKKAKEDSNE